MNRLRIALSIISATPLHVGAGGSSGTLADKTIVRDGWGRPIIPGSQLKGKTRWAVESLLRGLGLYVPAPFDEQKRAEQPTPVQALFGSATKPASLRFADLPGVIGAAQASSEPTIEQRGGRIRPSVALNRRRAQAEDARLLFQETALEGTRYSSEHAIVGLVPDPGYAALLWAGLRLTTRWGGATSRGLGWSTLELTLFLDDAPQDETELQARLRAFVGSAGGR